MADIDIGFPETEQTEQTLDLEPGDKKERAYGQRRVTKGPLLMDYDTREDEKKLAELHLKLWEAQDALLDRPTAQWGVNAARRAGIANAKVRYDDEDEHWTAWMPRGASADAIPDTNKAATLCRRLTANVFTDPFAVEVQVAYGDDDAAARAEISDRALQDLQGEHRLNDNAKHRRAFNRSHTYGSGYVWYFVDERGGGSRAVKIMARSDALNAELAFVDPLSGQEAPETKLEVDPATGQPIPVPVPPQERYVDEDGNFVDDPEDAAIEYVPTLDSEVLDSRHVRLLPSTADSIWEASGVLIAAMPTWGEVKAMAPDIAGLPEKDIVKILGYRPEFADTLLLADDDDEIPTRLGKDKDGNPIWNDERNVFMLLSYHTRSSEYEDGLHLITIGGCYVLHRSDWIDTTGDEKVALDLPLSQIWAWDEGRQGYCKVATMELIGGGNEARYGQIASWLDHLEKFNRQHTFVPTNSIVSEADLRKPRGTMIRINPGGEPKQLPIPPWPVSAHEFYLEQGRAMDDAVGLQTDPGPQTQSGRQEFAVISRVHGGLAEPRQNVENAIVRGGRIVLQLAHAFLEGEQEARWGGQGGRYRVQAWRGADLVTSPDVRLKPGSGTMLAPAAKAQLAERYASMGIMDQEQLREVITASVGGTIGLQDDPHRMRVLNQLYDFMEGPPDGWQPDPNNLIMPGGPDPQTGQMMPPQILDPELLKIWEPIPVDTLPQVAALRVKYIGDRMASPRYLDLPKEWRVGLETEFQRMGEAMSAMAMQAAGAEGEPVEPARDVPGLEQGKAANDLQEDALQEGAPPGLVT